MTVAELIKKLEDYPAEMDVVVAGYEGGYKKFNDIGTVMITREIVNAEWWHGDYDQDLKNGVEAVYLPR